MTRYAANTTVSTERSRIEIESTLKRYGATDFASGYRDQTAFNGEPGWCCSLTDAIEMIVPVCHEAPTVPTAVAERFLGPILDDLDTLRENTEERRRWDTAGRTGTTAD